MNGSGLVLKVLEVNLTTKDRKKTEVGEPVVRNFLGGLGICIKYLCEETGPETDALGPDNVIIISTGILSGTAAPTCGRTQLATKSPLTGILGTGNFGGSFGPRLRFAGFDAVIIRGQSESPVYLEIEDGQARLLDAAKLWGKDAWETTEILKNQLGEEASVFCIGPAGERVVRFACPVVDYDHAAGRSHAGCVMGVKKLKAITVKGRGKIPIADPAGFEEAVNQVLKRIHDFPERGERLAAGSHAEVVQTAQRGTMITGNFQSKELPEDSEIWKLPGSAAATLSKKAGSYGFNCPFAEIYGCDFQAEVKDGRFKGRKQGGVSFSLPSLEWGGKCGIKEYPSMWKCRELCQRYGMDQMTPIPFAMELYEKGIISREDLGGIDLKYGDERAVFAMLEKIAYREGLGDVFAEGTQKAAAVIGRGAEKMAISLKGMPWQSADPRVSTPAVTLGFITNPRGGDDLLSTHALRETMPGWARKMGWDEEHYLKWWVDYLDMFPEVKAQVFGSPPSIEALKPNRTQGKAAQAKWYGDLVAVYDSLGECIFPGTYAGVVGPTLLSRMYQSFTGLTMTPRELMRCGERIQNLMRLYITRHGIRRKDDDLPQRFYEEPIVKGAAHGAVAKREIINRLLDEFYELRGWDMKTGIPTREKINELGLGRFWN